MEHLFSDSTLSQGAIVALKMMGGVAAAAVILYLVLILTRVLGGKLEQKKYERYRQNYLDTHGSDEDMMTKEEFVAERAKGNAVVWKRGDKPPKELK